MRKTYITGANGFIGSHLARRIDYRTTIPHRDLDSWMTSDVYDRFFFCSGYGNMADHTEVMAIWKANVLDLLFVLDRSPKRFNSFVYISTSSVKRPKQTTYSRSKKAGEEVCLSYMERFNLPITIVRPLSVTGVGEQKDHLIPKLIDSCLNGTKMDFVPHPRHDFIDIEDFIDGVILLSDMHARGTFEVGRGVSYSNLDVLNIVEKVTGKKANVHIVSSMRAYDTKEDDWVCTNKKLFDMGWSPKKSLELSITEMVNDARRSTTN
jgi:nucleoside-diphosphate-sugar epimerase